MIITDENRQKIESACQFAQKLFVHVRGVMKERNEGCALTIRVGTVYLSASGTVLIGQPPSHYLDLMRWSKDLAEHMCEKAQHANTKLHGMENDEVAGGISDLVWTCVASGLSPGNNQPFALAVAARTGLFWETTSMLLAEKCFVPGQGRKLLGHVTNMQF